MRSHRTRRTSSSASSASSAPSLQPLALVRPGVPADVRAPVSQCDCPRDTVTLSPSLTPDLCFIKVWDERGTVACEVHVARQRATPEILTRILDWVRSWEDDDTASPPAVPAEERPAVALVVE